MPNDWISTDEAAEITSYHRDYIRQLIRRGKIQASRKGTMFWISRSSLLSFFKQAKKAKTSDRRFGPRKK